MMLFNSRVTDYRNPTGAVPFGTNIHFRIILPRNLKCSGAVLAVKDDLYGDSLINGKTLCIEGGNYRVCEGGECCIAKGKVCGNDECRHDE